MAGAGRTQSGPPLMQRVDETNVSLGLDCAGSGDDEIIARPAAALLPVHAHSNHAKQGTEQQRPRKLRTEGGVDRVDGHFGELGHDADRNGEYAGCEQSFPQRCQPTPLETERIQMLSCSLNHSILQMFRSLMWVQIMPANWRRWWLILMWCLLYEQ